MDGVLRAACHSPRRLQGLIFLAVVLIPLWATASELTIPYEVRFRGRLEGGLREDMEAISDAVALKDRPPATLSLLRSRAERDREEFLRFLRSVGYYGSSVETVLETEKKPVQVIFQVDTGPVYRLKSFALKWTPEARGLETPGADRLGIGLGEPFKAGSYLEAEKRAIDFLGRSGYPFPRVADRNVIVDHEDRSVAVDLLIDTGPEAVFGRLEIEGLESASEKLIRRKIRWKEGDRFDAEMLTLAQRELVELGLFSTVRVSPGEGVGEGGEVPVTVSVKERKHRSISAGVAYRTDEKLGVKFSWENRNLFGEGERLGLTTTFSDLAYAAEGVFREPWFYRDDQALTLSSRLAEDKPDAYTSVNLTSTALVVRDVTRTLKIGGGVGFKQSRVTQLGEKERFSLLFLPVQLAWDWSDDLLDPKRGGRLGVQVAPYADLTEEDLNFVKGKASYGHYLQVLASPSVVLAGRVGMGVVGGEERMGIPADERLYAGGGGSVRGYAYQSLAPLSGLVPTGGKSLLEVSLESRVKLTERFGLAFFVDGGNAFADLTPSSHERLFWGAGMGLRYFTPIGPFRLDVALPLDRREGVDSAFQLYVSIGQAF